MHHVKFTVGEKELHTVIVDYDMFSSKISLIVDDSVINTTVLTGKPINLEFNIGNSEKHRVRIGIRGKTIPVISVFIDDNLIGTFR
jgi:hypothetical protein